MANRDYDRYDYGRDYNPDYDPNIRNRDYRRSSLSRPRRGRGTPNRANYPNYYPTWDTDFDFDQGFDEDFFGTDWGTTPVWTYYEYWYVPGPFEGMGPSGYQRPDERIVDDINDRLTRHGRIDASNIQVDVNDGVVTLKGTVDNRQQKRLAEDVVDSVPGVEDIHNELRINRQGQTNQPQTSKSKTKSHHE